MYHKCPVHQMDVANAFLHGDLHETFYMSQPRGFKDSLHPNHVCLLKKAINGLKQAPRQWFNTFSAYLLSLGFNHSQSDHSLIILSTTHLQIYLVIYVDDILVSGTDDTAVQSFIDQISSKFTMKFLGYAHIYISWYSIQTYSNHYFLSQTPYALSILYQAGLQQCKPLSNPSNTKPATIPFFDPIIHNPLIYKQLTRSLQYLTITRPDIAYAVNVLCQHMHAPQPTHFHLLKRLFQYIQGTPHFGLPIVADSLQLRSFFDVDWASDIITRRSTTGYCSFLGSTLISWSVKKQHIVACSSTEAEYRAIAVATADILWLCRLLTEFNVSPSASTIFHCDNMLAIALANNTIFHAWTKHIEIDHHFLRDHIQAKHVRARQQDWWLIETVDESFHYGCLGRHNISGGIPAKKYGKPSLFSKQIAVFSPPVSQAENVYNARNTGG
ncbi:uncharacterized protein LOC110095338 [Dendrobium catenatum]|uniref:uncharacterized protein LOC110095338 n=1 Tax=Dendrobium catenatum TaxID=906689 RepID=UPI0009F443C4|nr:uncharacterized protein LOC110095338 [Dendrobium catenatum]